MVHDGYRGTAPGELLGILIRRLCVESFDRVFLESSSSLYDLQPGSPLSIATVLERWVQGNKATDRPVHGWYSPRELWPYREYTWTREDARRSPEEWDELVQSLKKDGWRENNPLLLFVGRNGVAKVGEGNHRLAGARELDLPKVPVRFVFTMEVDKDPQKPTPRGKSQAQRPPSAPEKEPTERPGEPVDEKELDDLMRLLNL
jgi:hypothetical protein